MSAERNLKSATGGAASSQAQIPDLPERLQRAEQILTQVAQGNFEHHLEQREQNDPMSSLEMGINFMIMDLRSMIQENQLKEKNLIVKQAELAENLAIIQKQADAIRELSTPIMEVWDDVLVLPVVGIVDTRRSVEIMDNLLAKIVNSQSRCVIIDITGVEIVDTKTADYLLKVAQAAQLLGARCVLTGINPAVAQTLVEIGADLSAVTTLRNLKAGLLECLRYLKKSGPNGKEG
jgi:rsbT co-antagonist protein RsbR